MSNNENPAEAQILSSQPFLLSFCKYDRSWPLISSYRRVSALCAVHHAVAELLFSFPSFSDIASPQTSHIPCNISHTIPPYPTPSPIPSSSPKAQPMQRCTKNHTTLPHLTLQTETNKLRSSRLPMIPVPSRMEARNMTDRRPSRPRRRARTRTLIREGNISPRGDMDQNG